MQQPISLLHFSVIFAIQLLLMWAVTALYATFIQRSTRPLTVFKCGSLSDSSRVSRLMRGFGKQKPSQPRWWWEDTAWDPSLIVQYWIDQPDNDQLTDAELAFKSFALFAIAVCPRCSDAARVVRSSVKFAPDGGDLIFRYFGTKELKVPILSAGIDIPAGQVSRVYAVRTLKAYLNAASNVKITEYGSIYEQLDLESCT